jgi:hypothetical protein
MSIQFLAIILCKPSLDFDTHPRNEFKGGNLVYITKVKNTGA